MKRDNKKALYEKIMQNVAREVKRTLNESNFSIESTVINNITKFQDITDNFFNQLDGYFKQYPILKEYMECLNPQIWISPVFETVMTNFKYDKIRPDDQRDIIDEWLSIFNISGKNTLKLDSEGEGNTLCFELNYDQDNYDFDTEVLADFIYKFIDLYNLEDEGNEYEWTSIYCSGTINQAFKKLLTIVQNYCDYVVKNIHELI